MGVPLYKYRSMAEGKTREYTLAILKNREVRYSPPSKFNDPFDCNLDIALRSTAEWEQMVERSVERLTSGISSFFSKIGESVRKEAEKKGVRLPPPAAPDRRQAKPPGAFEFTISVAGRRRDSGEVFNSLLQKQMKEFYGLLDASFGVFCLSERPDDILLWSHYANCHSGLCLQFDAEKHPKSFPRLHRVLYQDSYPHIPPEFPELLRLFRDKAGQGVREHLLDVAALLARDLASAAPLDEDGGTILALAVARWFYVKSSCWEYEREWRCLKRGGGQQSFPKASLQRIIVGCVQTDENIELVREALKDGGLMVPLYKAVRKPHEFGLDLLPVK